MPSWCFSREIALSQRTREVQLVVTDGVVWPIEVTIISLSFDIGNNLKFNSVILVH